MKVLVINAGSSSLKFSLLQMDGERVLGDGLADWSRSPARLRIRRGDAAPLETTMTVQRHEEAIRRVIDALIGGESALVSGAADIDAVGHRVVLGGTRYTQSVYVTADVKQAIAELSELAPLHNPANLAGIEAAETALPGVPQVAVFDTAFHAHLPEAARVYPLPYAWHEKWQLRRYGFHGLSHAYCSARAAEMLERSADSLRLIICHLGNGCSVSAVRSGVSVDTSMGFTPLEGLMMGTRSGSVDPGLLLYVLRRRGLTPEELERILNQESGLLGVSGVSSDMREVLRAADEKQPRARLALDIYVHRLRQTIGAFAATLGGVDALVFTAGIGEHAAPIRAWTCQDLGFLGLHLDAAANIHCRPDADIATPSSPGRILVIATREDVTIARETARLLAG
ncbi:MAG: acetate/propionate family kinase [Gemmataceae bacterium]